MARLSKFCPACDAQRPITLRVELIGQQPTTQIRYVATCGVCKQDILPDKLKTEDVALARMTPQGREALAKFATAAVDALDIEHDGP